MSPDTSQLSEMTPSGFYNRLRDIWLQRHIGIAILAGLALLTYGLLGTLAPSVVSTVLWGALAIGGGFLVAELLGGLFHGEFGSDLLAGLSIVTAALLQEPVAGVLVVLMLSGGQALETYAVASASSVLRALARRMPSSGHVRREGKLLDIPLAEISVGDILVVLPHETCPVDGFVTEGHGSMDEAYLTGEPYKLSKSVGSEVLSGAINGDSALVIQATRLAVDSRYARIMQVMESSQQNRPQLRRLGDQLGAWYTPIAVGLALLAWALSGDPVRFLAVLVVATPCPLLIAIPVAIIGSISLAARQGIVIRNPAILEQVGECHTMLFDKTGTLTYGEPSLAEQFVATSFTPPQVLQWVASLEQYSRHPLAPAIVAACEKAGQPLLTAAEVQELPGQGLIGQIAGHRLRVTSRKSVRDEAAAAQLPPVSGGLECVILVDEQYAATYQFRDQPRAESARFVRHLGPHHQIHRLVLVSGDRASEVEYLARLVGIHEIYAEQSPEQKLALVQQETAKSRTIYVGDGINDAPAMLAATVGLAIGQRSDVTAEAADAVLMDSSLIKVDELIHIGRRMRMIALQSAVGGMAASIVGMLLAAAGWLPPVAGAITQEVIDVIAVLNALRTAAPPPRLSDI